MIGREVGHYQILDNLGSGGMGEVWLAQDTRLERKVALKFLHYHAAQLEADKARFIQEAKAAARLNHSNIAQVHEIGESEGRLYIVMEYVAGGSLRDRLDDAGGRSFPVSQVIRWIRQTTEGLAEAHSQGIVHRDIKPDNLMLTDKDQVKITDFGLARLDTESRLTATGATLGTVSYMSPEQVLGSSVDQRADLFSVGATFYELLTGRQPFEGPDAAAIYYAIIHAEPDPIARYLKKADHHLDLMVKKLLQKDPGNRYQHADDLLVDLKQMEVSLADTQSMTLKVAAPKPKSEGIFETLSRPVVKWIALGGVVLTIALGLSLLINPRWFTSKDNQNEAVEQLFEIQRSERRYLGVLDLKTHNLDQEEVDQTWAISERLRLYLGKLGIFEIMERNRMTSIMEEIGFQYSGAVDTSAGLTNIGEILGVTEMLGGSISKVGSIYSIQIRLISVTTSGVIEGAFCDVTSMSAVLESAIRQVANSLGTDVHALMQISLDEFGNFTMAPNLDRLIVLQLEARNVPQGAADAITERLSFFLGRTTFARVLERESIDNLMEEMGFQGALISSDDIDHAVRIGMILGAEKAISGIVSQVGDSFTLQIRVISIETGAIEYEAIADVDSIEEVLTSATISVVNQLEDYYRDR